MNVSVPTEIQESKPHALIGFDLIFLLSMFRFIESRKMPVAVLILNPRLQEIYFS